MTNEEREQIFNTIMRAAIDKDFERVMAEEQETQNWQQQADEELNDE